MTRKFTKNYQDQLQVNDYQPLQQVKVLRKGTYISGFFGFFLFSHTSYRKD